MSARHVTVDFYDPDGLDADGQRGTRWRWTIDAEGADERVRRQIAAWRAEGRDITAEVRA